MHDTLKLSVYDVHIFKKFYKSSIAKKQGFLLKHLKRLENLNFF